MLKIFIFFILVGAVSCGSADHMILGDWVSDDPVRMDHVTMKGISLIDTSSESNENGWCMEGIMYDHLEDGVRVYPSSFEYRIKKDTLDFKIIFSSSGLERGAVYHLRVMSINNDSMTLIYRDQVGIYTRQE